MSTRNFKHNDRGIFKVKGRKKVYHANINPKKAGMTVLISDKVDLRAKKTTENSEWPLYKSG